MVALKSSNSPPVLQFRCSSCARENFAVFKWDSSQRGQVCERSEGQAKSALLNWNKVLKGRGVDLFTNVEFLGKRITQRQTLMHEWHHW